MSSKILLFSELNKTEQIILSGIRTWANNIRLNKNPILPLKCIYKPFYLENVSTLIDDLMSTICVGHKVHLDFRCNCNMIISDHEHAILEMLYYSQIKFYDLVRRTLSHIVTDKYIRDVMFISKKINKLLIKNKHEFECKGRYFNSNIACFNKHI